MKHKVDEKVIVNGTISCICDGNTSYPYKVEFEDGGSEWFSEEAISKASKNYEQGLADAWELAKQILYGIDKQLIEIFELNVEPAFFDLTHKRAIINDHTPEEVLAKIEAYKKEKEIKVGDEVKGVVNDGTVTKISDNIAYVLWKDGSCGKHSVDTLEKTGKHIDIESLLRQIGE